jgi:hypothetical protein
MEMFLAGSLIEKRFKYLQFNHEQDDFDVHIIVFSMTDRSSFTEAKKLVDLLDGKRIFVVGTRFCNFYFLNFKDLINLKIFKFQMLS